MQDGIKISIRDSHNSDAQATKSIILCENNICSVEQYESSKYAAIKMSNGDEFICISPSYDQWENDILNRRY